MVPGRNDEGRMTKDEGNPKPEIHSPQLTQNPKARMSPSLRHALILRLVLRHSSLVIRHSALCGLLLGAASLAARAQPTGAPPPDPLMTLMLSQPKIEISAPVKAAAAFDPPVVGPGQQAIYRVTFNALEQTIEWPEQLTAPPGLEMRRGAHGEILRIGGPTYVPLTAFNYPVHSSSPGAFSMPEFTVRVYGKPVIVPAARLQVISTPPSSAPPAQRILLELPATNLFVGQAVRARVLLPGTTAGVVQGLGQAQLSGQGFLVDLGGARQRIEILPQGGARAPTFIYETTLTPMVAGKVTVFAQGFVAGSHFSGPIVITGTATIPGGAPQYTLLETEPVELQVRPLPPEGELPGFTGAIGSFALGTPKLATNVVRVGDLVKLAVAVTNHGDGPLARLVAPPAPRVPNWQVFAPTEVTPPVALPQGPPGTLGSAETIQGVTTFNYTLIPLTEQAHATPAIPFSYFDPVRGCYADLTIPPVPVTVAAGAVPADLHALLQAAAPGVAGEKEPVLNGLAPSPGRTAASLVPTQEQAWFPLAQLAPAAAFAGLWGWDRRRRYYEKHPDLLLRRKARRNLRRQWRVVRRAAQAKDAPRFATAAVSAMQVACAPHYPAEPRALVGSDVLTLLGGTGSNGRAGQVVRRFFTVTDASRFATAGADAAELLALEPELEHVLQKLEERLKNDE
jgi:hypothetical protein